MDAAFDHGGARPGAIGGPDAVLRAPDSLGMGVLGRVGFEGAVDDVSHHQQALVGEEVANPDMPVVVALLEADGGDNARLADGAVHFQRLVEIEADRLFGEEMDAGADGLEQFAAV